MSQVRHRRDLTPFLAKLPWDERQALMHRSFSAQTVAMWGDESPETEMVWRRVMDPELMGRILKDILKADQATPGRPGPRPALDDARAQPVVDKWLGRDWAKRQYTTLPFGEAMSRLAEGRSLRNVSHLTAIPRMTVYRLMRGEMTPTSEMMVKVAQAFKKRPSFFVEWRIGAVASAIVNNLTTKPERSVRAYETLFWTSGGEHESG